MAKSIKPIPAKVKPAKIDSIPVGGIKRSVKDISKAVGTLAASKSGSGYVKGVNASNPVSSSRTLASKSSTSDLVNKVIDGSKKKRSTK